VSRRCQVCGAPLGLHNPGKLCFACQEKRREELRGKPSDTPHYTLDDMCFLLGLENPESVKRLGRKRKIPGRVPGVRKHLYQKEIVNRWMKDAGKLLDEEGERPRERAEYLERQLEELEHRNDIRSRFDNLKKGLEFPDPVYLWVRDDTETGEPVTRLTLSLRGDVLEWESDNGVYVIKLGGDLDPVMEHLRSSSRTAVLEQLEKWRRLAGECVKKCYELRRDIEREAQQQTKLSIVRDTGQRGLLDGFGMSVYWATLSSRGSSDDDYRVVGKLGDVCLLRYASSYNIAWVRADEVGRVKDWHEGLIRNCGTLSTKVDIGEAAVRLKGLTESLHQRLDEFAGLKVLPGTCAICPFAKATRAAVAPNNPA
jgi:hypothetical protein